MFITFALLSSKSILLLSYTMISLLAALFHAIFDMVQSLSGYILSYVVMLPSLTLYEKSPPELST